MTKISSKGCPLGLLIFQCSLTFPYNINPQLRSTLTLRDLIMDSLNIRYLLFATDRFLISHHRGLYTDSHFKRPFAADWDGPLKWESTVKWVHLLSIYHYTNNSLLWMYRISKISILNLLSLIPDLTIYNEVNNEYFVVDANCKSRRSWCMDHVYYYYVLLYGRAEMTVFREGGTRM